jgi:hypothetical protein
MANTRLFDLTTDNSPVTSDFIYKVNSSGINDRKTNLGSLPVSTATQTALNTKIDKTSTGWASYVDTQYTAGSPFAISPNTNTILPNNANIIIDNQKPTDIITFYDPVNQKITGRNGDGLDMMIYFFAKPTQNDQWLDVWLDISGIIGRIFDATFSFPKGNNVERGVLYAIPSAYTGATWEANGATIYVRSNNTCNIYGMIYNFDRSHKAR